MPIIAPKQVVPGTTIEAQDVNTPVNTIAGLVNGNLDQDNIADGTIGGDKLATNAVGSSDKIADSVILPRHLDPSVLAPGNYSLEEVDTGLLWVDGGTIYKKTINTGGMATAGQTKTVPHGLPTGYYIISYSQFVFTPTFGQVRMLPYADSDNNTMECNINASGIQLTSSNDQTTFSQGYCTILYIKN